jgi:hypothetical protein
MSSILLILALKFSLISSITSPLRFEPWKRMQVSTPPLPRRKKCVQMVAGCYEVTDFT